MRDEALSEHGIVLVGDDGWRVGRVAAGEVEVRSLPEGGEAPLGVAVGAVRDLLAEWGLAGRPVVLALGSSWCLSATISTEELERGGRRRAMGFRLEEHLPISAEEFVAQFIEAGNGEALGVCGEVAKLKAIIDAFEQVHIEVRYICPAALLAAAHALAQQAEVDAVLIGPRGGSGEESHAGTSGGYDLVELRQGKPARWWWTADDGAAMRERVGAFAGGDTRSMQMALIGCNGEVRGTAEMYSGLRTLELEGSTRDESAARFAARVMDESASPWINLRCGALAAPNRLDAYQRPLAMMVVAVVLLVAGVIGVAAWRGLRYQAIAEDYRAKQTEVFKEAMPGQRVTMGNVKARLVSEQRRLSALGGLSGNRGADETAVVRQSALEELGLLLGALPTNVRFRILDLSIQPDLIRIDGEARSQAEADQIAASLQQSGHFEVEAPTTQALRGRGVRLTFTARPRDAAGRAKGGK